MSVTVAQEKAALVAVFVSALAAAVPGAGPANVDTDVLPEPCTLWPHLVIRRRHWITAIEYAGGNQLGNPDGDPNIYDWEYHTQLAAQTGQTVAQVMAQHDAFLEQLLVAFQSRTNQALAASGTPCAFAAGESIACDTDPQGPYALRSGSAVLLSNGAVTVKQIYRGFTP